MGRSWREILSLFFLGNKATVDVWQHDWYANFLYDIPSLVDSPCFSEYDLLIFPKPYGFSKGIRQELINQSYHGKLMVEKMVADSEDELADFCRDVANCSCTVMHQRLYSPVIDAINSGKDFCVRWPISYCSGMDPFKNILPNFLDEYYKCHRQLPILTSVENTDMIICFQFKNNISLVVYPDESKLDKVKIGDTEIPWPDVFSLMPLFIQDLKKNEDRSGTGFLYEKELVQYISHAKQIYLKK